MNENKVVKDEEIEINLQRIFNTIWNRLWVVVLVGIVGAAIALGITRLFITPMYQSSAMFYVNNSDVSLGEASLSISTGDISASRGLVKSYIVILKTRESINAVIDYAGVKRSYGEVRNMITAAAVDDTEIFRVTVTSEDPYEAERIANAIAYILPKRISSIIEGTSAKIVDSAVVASGPSAPNYTRNAMLGFALGLLLTAAYLVIRELVDVSFVIPCDEQHPHKEQLAEDGVTLDITFDLGIAPDETVIVMVYVDDQWVPVEIVNNGDGTVTGPFEDICPVVFCVRSELPPAQTGDIAGQNLIVWMVLMAVSLAAVVVLLMNRRKFMR